MSSLMVSQLEDLSVEVLIEIFEYLTADELYSSFSRLNTRLNSILKSQPNLIVVTRTHLDPVLSFFDSFIAVYMKFCRSSRPYLSQFTLSNFVGIRSFHIRKPRVWFHDIGPIDQLDILIRPDLCPRLESLRLPYCSSAIAEFIFTGAFPHLKICHFGQRKSIPLPLSTTTTLQYLRQLTMDGQNGADFEKILSICPHLSYLNFSCNQAIISFIRSNLCFLSLKHLRLSRFESFRFHDGQFDSLLSLFPNLLQFHFTADQYQRDNERIEFDKLADYLRHRLPRLKILNWLFYVSEMNQYSLYTEQFEIIARMHPLFKFLGKCQRLIHITSVDFTPKHCYQFQFVRPPSE